jgi:hypothetical protein
MPGILTFTMGTFMCAKIHMVQYLAKPAQSVVGLSHHLQGKNCNIMADNRFYSIQLVQLLKERGLTYVGTLRSIKSEIPEEFLANR